MWPDNESEIDLLRASYIARAVIGVVKTPGLLPTSIGVYGDWGSGKSTVLKMVERDLAKDEAVLTVWFNGWFFEGYQDVRSALMGSILDTVKRKIEADESRFAKAKEKLLGLVKRVDLMRVTGAVVPYGLPTPSGARSG